MSKIFESGVARNIDAFGRIITECKALGAKYNPANASLKVTALQQAQSSALAEVNKYNKAVAEWKEKINERQLVFEKLELISKRAMSAFKASQPGAKSLEEAQFFMRKLTGRRKEAVAEAKEGEPSKKTISVSQTSYVNKAANFDKLVQAFEVSGKYVTNEADLTLAALKAFRDQLLQVTEDTNLEFTDKQQLKDTQKKLINDLVDLSRLVKEYVKSVTGPTDPQAIRIREINLKKINR